MPKNSIVRRHLNRLLSKLNLRGDRFKTTGPYDYLLKESRYIERTLQLGDYDFTVTDTRSFYYSYREIFERHIYRFHASSANPYIIDCGANYGASIVYYKGQYPQASIVGVEADPEIYKILKRNLSVRGYQDVSLINKAVSGVPGARVFYREGADAGRLHPLEGCESVEVMSVTLDDLITRQVDFMKIDIEGAEMEALQSCRKINMVRQMFVEYHSFLDKEQELGRLLELLTDSGFRYYIHTQYCSPTPLSDVRDHLGMDMQLNIFANRD